MIVSGKQGTRSRHVMQVFNDGPCNRYTIMSARASTNFIKDNQAVFCRMKEYRCRFFHLDHEGTFTRCDVILGTNTGKNAIDQPDTRAACRHKTADLR